MSKKPEVNPLIDPPKLPHDAPPLDTVKARHFLPALKQGIEEARAEIAAIKNSKEPATFENTIEALEFSGKLIDRTLTVFGNVAAANSNENLRKVEEELNVQAVQFSSEKMMDADLFKRVKEVYDKRDTLNLQGEKKVLLEETYKAFVRSGALLDDAQKQRLREIQEAMSKLRTTYKNNVLKSTEASVKVVETEAELKGIPQDEIDDFRRAAEEAGMKGKFLIKMSPPPITVLTHAENRALREDVQRTLSNIAYGDKYDNTAVAMQIAKLRHEAANIMGYKTHAD